MKLLTLNTHSLEEENYQKKLNELVSAVIEEKPDIIALQEVNQTKTERITPPEELEGMTLLQREIPVRRDNHALSMARMLGINRLRYNWVWLPVKTGYGRYDEGLAIMSLHPIENTAVIKASKSDDYENWKTRRIPGIKTNGEWFYSVHMGWWNDDEEPFSEQWARISAALPENEKIWLMGDFNSRADVRGEGYDLVRASGWYDTYELAAERGSGYTVSKQIDGWRGSDSADMRIDYVFTNRREIIKSSAVVFNGVNYPSVSDHCGVMIEL